MQQGQTHDSLTGVMKSEQPSAGASRAAYNTTTYVSVLTLSCSDSQKNVPTSHSPSLSLSLHTDESRPAMGSTPI